MASLFAPDARPYHPRRVRAAGLGQEIPDAQQRDENPEALLKVGAALRAQLPAKDFPLQNINTGGEFEQQVRKAASEAQKTTASGQTRALNWTDLPDISQYPEISTTNTEITKDDIGINDDIFEILLYNSRPDNQGAS